MKKIALVIKRVLLIAAVCLSGSSVMAAAPQVFSTDPNLPPLPGVYVSPALWHAAYAQGIIIRDVSHNRFTQNLPLPPLGGSQSHSFGSQLQFELSTDGGVNYQPASGSANVSVDVTHTTDDPDGTKRADTEMTALSLDIVVGATNLKLRESPTLPSKGKTTIKAVAGGAMMSSFFDIFTEVSVDGGATWLPAQQAAHVELRNDAGAVTAVTEPTPLLPPPAGVYVSPDQWHAAYAQGVIISNVSHKQFTDSHPPPTAGTIQHTFNSQLDLQFSVNGGNTFQHARAAAGVQVQVTKVQGQGSDGLYDTEMLSLSFNLPGGIMVRESPTLPSRGQTQISAQADGTHRIGSFFDIFTELSTDGGQTWSPSTTGPVRVELTDPAPEQPGTGSPDLPPSNGQYVSPDQWHAAYAAGIVISNVAHLDFLQKQPPPPPGGSQVHTFGSAVQMMVSLDGGQTFIPASAQANVAVRVQSSQDSGSTRFFDTEMLQLSLNSISGGGLPPGMRLRESPTKASLGRTSIRQELATGLFRISSFFDVFTEVSLDGGGTWLPNTTGPASVGLRLPPPAPVAVVCPADIVVTAAGPGGAVVTFTASGSGGCAPVTVTASPPSGSLFPIGTTTVTVVAKDACGNVARCTFHVTVNPPTTTVPEYFFKQRKVPPTDGVYISPALWHALYANGIVIRDVRHRGFLQNFDLPPAGGTSTHSFGSTVDFEVSTDNGTTFSPATGSANVTVRVTHSLDSGGKSFFDTEMLALDLTSSTIRLRESPTLPSRGQTTVRTVAGGFMLSSFFDVETEVSTDGGLSWVPGQQPGHVELRPDPKRVDPVGEPTSLLPPPNDQYVSPQQWHALYAQGIVIRDVRHKFFTDSHPPPPTGGTTTHLFNSQLDLQVSTDGGNTFQTVRVSSAPVQVQVSSASAGSDAMYDTEMLSLNLTLPSGAMVRESPTEPSRGGTRIVAEADGSYRIHSFFDIFTELSVDGGATWSPAANGPVRVELQSLAPEQTETSPNLPPPADEYISPEKWHALYANGIIISNASHNRFTQSQPPPPPGGSQTHSFGSQVEMDVIVPGQPPVHVSSPANVVVQVGSTTKDTGDTRFFDTEMLALNLIGLPGGMMIRESPTRASLGRTSMRLSGTQFRIGSFFDIFTELSTDGGQTWFPVVGGPASVRLRNPLVPPVSILCPPDIYTTATGLAGAAVTFVVPAAGGCDPVPTIICTPPSGSVFPIGTTTVTCVAQDSCGNAATCTFKVIVRKPVKKRVFPTTNLPPPNGQYVSPADWHAAYASGIYLTNASHKRFTQSFPPPPPGGSETHSFGSRVEMDVLQPGLPPVHVVVPNVQVTVQVTSTGASGSDQHYDTEMLQLNLQGGNLPPGMMIRESPTKASTGKTSIQPTTGGFAIDSFFDVFTELSLDGGQTWDPTTTPARMELGVDASGVSANPSNLHLENGDLAMTVPTHLGLFYFIEAKDLLTDPDWFTLSGGVGTGEDAMQTDFYSSGLKQRFYRVRMEEVHPNPTD